MKRRTTRAFVYTAFVLATLSAAASGTIAFKKAPLVDRMRQELSSTTDNVNSSMKTIDQDLLLCFKHKAGSLCLEEATKRRTDLAEDVLRMEQLNIDGKELNTSFKGYLGLFISSGILAFLFGALSLAAHAYGKKQAAKNQEGE